MPTLTDTRPVAVTGDDFDLLFSVHDALEKASTGNVDPVELWRLSREFDATVTRWRAEQREAC